MNDRRYLRRLDGNFESCASRLIAVDGPKLERHHRRPGNLPGHRGPLLGLLERNGLQLLELFDFRPQMVGQQQYQLSLV